MLYAAPPPGGDRIQIANQITDGNKKGSIFEKPLARDGQEAVEIVNIFKSAGIPLYVAYYRRHLPYVIYVKSFLEKTGSDKEELQIVTGVCITLHQARHLDSNKHACHLDKNVSGWGLLLDVGSHMIDLMDYLVGPLESVVGHASAVSPLASNSKVEDSVVGCWTHRMPDGRAVPGSCSFNFACGGEQIDRLEIIGTAGSLSFTCFQKSGKLTIQSKIGRKGLSKSNQCSFPFCSSGCERQAGSKER
jgi:1,5-anhydro-D-fructose reductase (1,5-anhydro-D-mannitol-forming)